LTLLFITLVAITAILYGLVVTLTPVEARAMLYMSWGRRQGNLEGFLKTTIAQHGLDDPYPVQYIRWVSGLLRGDWGWSPSVHGDVLDILLRGTPATAELLLFSVLLFIPLGISSGVTAGWRRGRLPDHGFRLLAFTATSIPPFVLGLMLMGTFYIGLHWFSIGRLSGAARISTTTSAFKVITGLITVDGLLNGRLDVTFDALRGMFLPAFTLSLSHWATLGRVTRAAMIEELDKDYIATARGKGLSMRWTVWRHALPNVMVPGLNSIALSAAALVTGTYIVELVFGYPGISRTFIQSVGYYSPAPDVTLVLGFAVYSVLLVLPLMFVLDMVQAIIDPRIREGDT
jgi:ABC-type dipeptide/oligopeptide/nickel transport system permease component